MPLPISGKGDPSGAGGNRGIFGPTAPGGVFGVPTLDKGPCVVVLARAPYGDHRSPGPRQPGQRGSVGGGRAVLSLYTRQLAGLSLHLPDCRSCLIRAPGRVNASPPFRLE